MTCTIKIGTSGYDYLDWKKVFYDEKLQRSEFLKFYSSVFNTVELNFCYYRMPWAKQLFDISKKTPENFTFSIKAHQSLTHKVDAGWKDAAAQYMKAVDALRKDDKLASVLLQFPYSFHYNKENRRYLTDLTTILKELPLIVEFRNNEWFNRKVFDGLVARNIGLCSVDMPSLKGLPPAIDMVTADTAYIRFHGRNNAQWWGSDIAERFNYLYSEDELSGWKQRITSMSEKAKQLLIYFNNHRSGKAVENAKMLKKMLSV